jgi:hypothetical protein
MVCSFDCFALPLSDVKFSYRTGLISAPNTPKSAKHKRTTASSQDSFSAEKLDYPMPNPTTIQYMTDLEKGVPLPSAASDYTLTQHDNSPQLPGFNFPPPLRFSSYSLGDKNSVSERSDSASEITRRDDDNDDLRPRAL